MKKIVLLALLAVAFVAAPAFASVQNVKVSGDINSTFVSRYRFDLGNPTEGNRFDQNFFMTQTKLRVDADLTDKVSTTVALINERAWDAETRAAAAADNTGDTEIDLNLAYVTIKEMLYSPLTVVVGRQAFAFGNSFVIDSMGPNRSIGAYRGGLQGVAEDLTQRKAMDAIRLILDYNPLTIDLVYSKIDANNLTGEADTSGYKDDVDLLGTNLNYKLGDKMNTVVEAYFWAKSDNSNKYSAGRKTDTVYMPGARVAADVLDGLNLGAEVAMQRGTYSRADNDNVKREAIAYQLIGNYALPFEQTKEYRPVLTTAFSYFSGDKGPLTGTVNQKKYSGWDPMFENQNRGKIFNTLFNQSNAMVAQIKGTISPIEDVTAAVEWSGLWLAKKINNTPASTTSNFALYQPDGTSLTPALNKDNTKLGDELDLYLTYAYTEDVTIGATLGWFKPGDLFQAPNRKTATQAMVNMDVKF